jgi:hypothetical protein
MRGLYKVAANKRNPIRREKDYELIADLYLRGHKQSEISAQLHITQQQVSYDLKVLQKRWQAASCN